MATLSRVLGVPVNLSCGLSNADMNSRLTQMCCLTRKAAPRLASRNRSVFSHSGASERSVSELVRSRLPRRHIKVANARLGPWRRGDAGALQTCEPKSRRAEERGETIRPAFLEQTVDASVRKVPLPRYAALLPRREKQLHSAHALWNLATSTHEHAILLPSRHSRISSLPGFRTTTPSPLPNQTQTAKLLTGTLLLAHPFSPSAPPQLPSPRSLAPRGLELTQSRLPAPGLQMSAICKLALTSQGQKLHEVVLRQREQTERTDGFICEETALIRRVNSARNMKDSWPILNHSKLIMCWAKESPPFPL